MVKQDNPLAALDVPIAGQSLTAPLGDRPWQKPAKYSTPDEALTFYMDRLSVKRNASQMLDLLENGVPVDTLVDIMQTGAVMEGIHSLDVGIVVSPALAEAIMAMADAAEVPYVEFSEDIDTDEAPYDTEVALALKEIAEEAGTEVAEKPVETEMVEEEKSRGLMSRRTV